MKKAKTAKKTRREKIALSWGHAKRLLEDGRAYQAYQSSMERAREDVKERIWIICQKKQFETQFKLRFIEALTRTLIGVKNADDIDIFIVAWDISFEFQQAAANIDDPLDYEE